ncbi:hypothetical protein HK101_001522 [Irineochytrium annulatum]|nr:hypothetical protein HK101_001522 [Irineochytrium annulatum]
MVDALLGPGPKEPPAVAPKLQSMADLAFKSRTSSRAAAEWPAVPTLGSGGRQAIVTAPPRAVQSSEIPPAAPARRSADAHLLSSCIEVFVRPAIARFDLAVSLWRAWAGVSLNGEAGMVYRPARFFQGLDASAYGMLAQAACESPDASLAIWLAEAVEGGQFAVTDSMTAARVVIALAMARRLLEARRLLARMDVDGAVKPLEPLTTAALLRSCVFEDRVVDRSFVLELAARAGRLGIAESAEVAQGITFVHLTMNAAVKESSLRTKMAALARKGDMDAVRSVLDTMEILHGVEPTARHKNQYVVWLARNARLEEAEAYLDRMGDGQRFAAVMALVEGCKKTGDVEMARRAMVRLKGLSSIKEREVAVATKLMRKLDPTWSEQSENTK